MGDAAKKKRKQHPVAAALMVTDSNVQEFAFDVPSKMVMANDEESKEDDSSGLVAEIAFFGNYSEPNLCVPLSPLLIDCGNEPNEEKELFTINKRPKDDLSPRAKPGVNTNGNGNGGSNANEGEFVCRMVMDIATKQWTVEQGVALEQHVVVDSYKLSKPGEPYWRQELYFEDDSTKTPQQLKADRKQREADRARRDAERAKKRLARKNE